MRISERGWKWDWTLYLFDRNLDMFISEDLPFLRLLLQASHLDEVDAGFWFPFAWCGLHERKIFWGPTWLSWPVSIHKRGVRPAVFAETAVALVEGGGKQRHSWHY